MIGTSYEMMLYLSYDKDVQKELKRTNLRMNLLRHRLSEHRVPEELLADMLTRLGCRCIRPRVILPCIVKDKNGRLYDEHTFVKLFFTQEFADKHHADYSAIMGIATKNHSIKRHLFKHLLLSRRAWIVLDNMMLDSVWSYEPIELDMTADKVKQVRNMLVSSVPVEEDYYKILTYQRLSQRLVMPAADEQHPEE